MFMIRSALTALALILVAASNGEPVHALQQPTTHVMVEGETLAQLARQYLGDPARWQEIARANGIADPHRVQVGAELAIPATDGAGFPETAGAAEPTESAEAGQSARPEPARAEPAEPAESIAEAQPAAPPEQQDREERAWRIEQADRTSPSGRSTAFRSEEAGRRRNQVQSRDAHQRMAVPQDAFYSAEWLVPSLSRPLGSGTLRNFVAMEGARRFQGVTARPFDELEIAVDTDFSPREGQELQVFRVVRQIEGLGWVVRPTGSVTVLRDEGESVVGMVNRQFAPIALGDQVRPVPDFPLSPGQEAQDVQVGSLSATILEWGDPHQLQQFGDVAFLDVGTRDGVAVGDEFVVAAQTEGGVSPNVAGRLQVVGVSETVASARVVQQDGPVFDTGVTVYLAKKMR
jgi:nucleoid-associated protein YgaU